MHNRRENNFDPTNVISVINSASSEETNDVPMRKEKMKIDHCDSDSRESASASNLGETSDRESASAGKLSETSEEEKLAMDT